MPYFPLTMCEPKRSEDEENVDPGHRKGNINSSVTTSTRICKVRTTHMSEHVNGKVYNNNRDPANVQECKIKRVRAHVSGEKNNRVVVDGINLDESANQSSGDKDTMHKSPRRSKKTSAMKHKPPLTERQQVALLLKDQAQKQPAPAVQAVSAVSEPDEISRFAEKFLCTPRPVLPSHKKTSPVHKYVSATNVPLQVKAVDPKLAPLIKIVRPRTAATNRDTGAGE
ncbi:hypothetical protein SARC_07432 [Sphaeroforma arctica JP610]|uniref:Uncharacterized protein n=1 Tax=Sphaeroforma arctica JP610 TaxID=667725 RepID=A0A0L0FTS2_9EUKA|nr:hypothetical protein SARC_07432 [Sphaeroforma arctica JP610]KNC80207.1 hypothetical protein SARC_07432 [Sphaeroforma arctica JP610]|eukprot:XP_014154109.1 hypothetical protein SARC_07432 [Sphaeroforma arctica JP610]